MRSCARRSRLCCQPPPWESWKGSSYFPAWSMPRRIPSTRLGERASTLPRAPLSIPVWNSIARLETAVLMQLPSGVMRPTDLVAAASQRLGHAQAVLGPVEIVGITELSPCWRPLLQALTHHTAVSWTAGPRPTPSWLEATGVTVTRSAPQTPALRSVSAATAYHEAIEAVRWARSLLASGTAEAADIAIAAASSAEYDDHFLALRADANLDLHFVHGIKVTATRDGQAAAALADILIRGFSQTLDAPSRRPVRIGERSAAHLAGRLDASSTRRRTACLTLGVGAVCLID